METLPFDKPEFTEAWNEWLQYRKERRLPAYKPTGLKRTFSGLLRDSNSDVMEAIKIIHNSIEKNWQGLFPLKNNQNGNQHPKTKYNGSNRAVITGTAEGAGSL